MASSANTAGQKHPVNNLSVVEKHCQETRTRTVELYGWQAELLGDLGVFDLSCLFQRQTLDAFGHIRARGYSAPTTKGLKLDVRDDSTLVDPDL